MTTLNKAATALKLYADGFRDKNSFNTEFMKLFPDFPRATAGYFSDAFRHYNPGASQRKGRAVTVKAPKEPKPVKEKVLKAKKVVKAPKAAKADTSSVLAKSPEEIARIKSANLARMKAVAEKTKKYTMVARDDGPGVENFNPEQARAEVNAFLYSSDELPSFQNPKFLSADEVKALV